jgi:hypothetical protein
MRNFHHDSYTKKLFGYAVSWRGTAYWKTVQCVAAGDASQQWRHHSKFNGRKTRGDRLLYEVYSESWLSQASSPDWHAGKELFIEKALLLSGMCVPALSRKSRKEASAYKHNMMTRCPRVLDYDATVVPWVPNPAGHGAALEILSDSQLVVNWLAGRARVTGHYLQRVASFQNLLQSSWQACHLSPRLPWMDFVRHIYRERNVLADEAAKRSLEQKADFLQHFPAMAKAVACPPRYLRIYTDGSHCDGLAAAGWVILGAWDVDHFQGGDDCNSMAEFCGSLPQVTANYDLVMPQWQQMLSAGRYLGSATIVNAEFAAIEAGIDAVRLLQNL